MMFRAALMGSASLVGKELTAKLPPPRMPRPEFEAVGVGTFYEVTEEEAKSHPNAMKFQGVRGYVYGIPKEEKP
jgi:hypothetical protein